MPHFIYKYMIFNSFINTTNLQQKHNKFYFVAETGNELNLCCVIVIFVTFSFTDI
jgi:hypothetical protein